MTKTSNHDLSCISPMLHAAIEKIAPDYLKMSPEERENWRASRVTDTKDAHEAIFKELLQQNFGYRKEDLSKDYHGTLRLNIDVLNAVNRETISISGIGDDMFMLNCGHGKGKTLLDFETVRDFDMHEFAIQQGYFAIQQGNLVKEERSEYRGYLYHCPARILQDGELRYLSLFTLSRYLELSLESYELSIIKDLIPYHYEDGPEHGKKTKDGLVRHDKVLKAGGKEDQHRALSIATHHYIAERAESVLEERDANRSGQVWVFDDYGLIKEDFPEPDNLTVVFSDQDALAKVRFRHFTADCAANAGKIEDLASILEEEKKGLRQFMEAAAALFEKSPEICSKRSEEGFYAEVKSLLA